VIHRAAHPSSACWCTRYILAAESERDKREWEAAIWGVFDDGALAEATEPTPAPTPTQVILSTKHATQLRTAGASWEGALRRPTDAALTHMCFRSWLW
jgi:hypothetical protein